MSLFFQSLDLEESVQLLKAQVESIQVCITISYSCFHLVFFNLSTLYFICYGIYDQFDYGLFSMARLLPM